MAAPEAPNCGCWVELHAAVASGGAHAERIGPIHYCRSHAHIAERGLMKPCGCHVSPDLTDGGCVWEVAWCPLHAHAEALADALEGMLDGAGHEHCDSGCSHAYFLNGYRALLREIGR